MHARIMNLQAKPSGLEDSASHIYRIGHRDARHAAAEIASDGDALIADLLAALERAHEWLQGSEPGRAQYIGEVIARAKGEA